MAWLGRLFKRESTPGRAGSHPVQFAVAPDTTVFVGPLNADGTVNYTEALNRKYGTGVTPENNAAVRILQALGFSYAEPDQDCRDKLVAALGIASLPSIIECFSSSPPLDLAVDLAGDFDTYLKKQDEFEERVRLAMTRPANQKDDPAIFEWLKANDKPLELIVAASRCPKYFIPTISSKSPPSLADRLTQACPSPDRRAVQALTVRALIKADAGDFDGATADLAAVHGLARLKITGLASFVDHLVAASEEFSVCRAEHAIVRQARLSAWQARAMLHMLDSIGPLPLPGDALGGLERFFALDDTMRIARHGLEAAFDSPDAPAGACRLRPKRAFWPFSRKNKPLPPFELDGSQCLREVNRYFDLLVEGCTRETYAERKAARRQAAEDILPEVKAILGKMSRNSTWRDAVIRLVSKIGTADPRRLARGMVDLYLVSTRPLMSRPIEIAEVARAQHDLTTICLALAVYRAEKGEYPASLDELSPSILKAVPLDPFTDQPMQYQRKGKGYLLYSVGGNMKDDGGKGVGVGLEPTDPDDIAVEME